MDEAHAARAEEAIEKMKADSRWDGMHNVAKNVSQYAATIGIIAAFEHEYRRSVMASLPSVKNAKVVCTLETNFAQNATDEKTSCK